MKTINRRFLILSASALLLIPAYGQKNKNVLDLKSSIEDSKIVFPESYEADIQKLMEKWYLQNYTTTDIESTSQDDPGATDDQIRERLSELPTIIDMPYNSIVKSYIERFTKKGRKQVTALLGLSTYYLPIFEAALARYGLPLELKYLPIVESGLDPTATSQSGAAGLWQFMPQTANGLQMEFNSLVDERRDPYISTDKACQYLKTLYETYGDWSLAIAAYNCGPGTLNKAINRAGGDASSHDFWSLYYYLPEDTRGYVPMFIATNYVMNYYPEHDIAPVLPTRPLVTDTVHVTNRVHFDQISNVLDIPIEEIRILNPQFCQDIIPGSGKKAYNLILPSQQVHAFLVSEDDIYAYDQAKYARLIEAAPGNSNVVAVVPDPYNPADPAPAEAQAANEVYQETHPEQNPRSSRRRESTSSNPNTTASQPASTSKSTNTNTATTQSTQTTKKNNNTTANNTSTTKKNTQTTTAKSNNSTKAATTTKNNTTANNTSTTKKNTQTTPAKNNNTKAATTKNNTQTASTTKKQTTQQATTSKQNQHTVANGESYYSIAKKTGVSVNDLKKANGNKEMLHPGDKLVVPKATTTTKSAATTTTTKAANNNKTTTSNNKSNTNNKAATTKNTTTNTKTNNTKSTTATKTTTTNKSTTTTAKKKK